MKIQDAIGKVIERIDLTQEEMEDIMRQVMTGQCTNAQIAGLLIGLRMKSESIDEITGAAKVMRELATPVAINAAPLVDIVGTGGDGANLFNISSASAFVAAAAGAHIAKHGNRGVSSSSGSADVIEALGVKLGLEPAQVAQCVEEVGVGFMFAPAHHSAMKHAIAPRKELGQRTLFNILGPMTNPAGAKRMVIGVFNSRLCAPMAEVMGRLGAEHVLVVNGKDGLDEISLATATSVAELKDGTVTEYEIIPEDLGISSQTLVGLQVNDAAQSLDLIRAAFGGATDDRAAKARDIIALNAGAAIYVAGLTATHKEAVQLAKSALESGAAKAKLDALAELSHRICEE